MAALGGSEKESLDQLLGVELHLTPVPAKEGTAAWFWVLLAPLPHDAWMQDCCPSKGETFAERHSGYLTQSSAVAASTIVLLQPLDIPHLAITMI